MSYQEHIDTLYQLLTEAEATDGIRGSLTADQGFEHGIQLIGDTASAGGKVMIIGNGGSAAIAGHLAIDLVRNGGVAAMTFNEAASLTCMGNDFGYEQIFSRQLAMHASVGDLLIAISSSGQSVNILNAVAEGRARNCRIITLSGFDCDNPLRQMGDLNFYIASDHYGRVELSHMALCHAFLDLSGGWWQDDADRP
ncbi:MAG: SIS domain-containing protein [Candidatus Sedimenticola sp. (ex Thyasira tokunagai)]